MDVSNIVYFSNLKPGINVRELCQAANLDANIDEAIRDIVPHGKNATFVIFSDRFVDVVIAHRHGKPFVGE